MCRNFFIILDGEATVKLTPPKNSKYLYTEKDYDNFEFKSPVNPWDPQKEYENDFNKIKCLDVKLNRGKLYLFHLIGGIVYNLIAKQQPF